MILPDHQIAVLGQRGMVTPFDPELLNPASIDVRLLAPWRTIRQHRRCPRPERGQQP